MMETEVDTTVGYAQTPDGRKLEVSGILRASPENVWDVLVDTATWPVWGPSVTAVDCEAPNGRIRADTRGRIRIPLGVWVRFSIATFDPDHRRWTWRVARVPATGHRVELVDGEKRCRVVFEVPVAAPWYVPVCRRAIRRIEDLVG